jgi:hypothetical protein
VRRALPRLLRGALGAALAATLVVGGRASADDDRLVLLRGPTDVQGLLREDVDGDGITDLLVVEGRTLWVWRGRKGALPAPDATRLALPDDASFVDAAGDGRVAVLGLRGLRLLDLRGDKTPDGKAVVPLAVPGLRPPEWRDPDKAVFADLVRKGGGILAPVESGWQLVPLSGAGDPVPLDVEPLRYVTAPGQFLEDSCAITEALPEVFVAPGAAPTLWAYSGERLVAQSAKRRTTYDVSFLPPAAERRLADLDADGVPDVVEGEGTNQDLRVAFFRTPPPPADGGAEGGSLKPPLASLHLTGFPIEPRTVDLDGDGRPDFLVTTIEIDQKNILRAVTSGKVTARTRAFLNRLAHPGDALFAEEPDATIWSDVVVRIRFGYAGNFDVRRSFTLVVDGDYDGDGRKDLLIRTGPDEMRLRPGTPKGVWDSEGRTVRIPPMDPSPDIDGWAADLDGDGKDEMILLYRKPPGGADRLFVVRP